MSNRNRKLVPSFKVVNWDINQNKVEYYDVMPYFIREWDAEKKRKYKLWSQEIDGKRSTKMPETFDEFKYFIKSSARYQFWSRCEYEIIISDWPCQKHEQKIDVYDQIEANLIPIVKIFKDYVL